MIPDVRQFEGTYITINVCENCLLRCKYCYETKKAIDTNFDKSFWAKTQFREEKHIYPIEKCDPRVISIDTVKIFFDKLLAGNDPLKLTGTKFEWLLQKGVVIDFIGGDALQYPEICDEIISYFVLRMNILNHPWKNKWRFSISSNGLPLLLPEVRRFLIKWKNSISLGLSIDGCPELHDLNRVIFPTDLDGKDIGSWKYIEKVFPWYRKNFPMNSLITKWTVASNGYKYLFESVKFLEKLGIKYLHFNRVMEDDFIDTKEDIRILYDQFEKIFDWLITEDHDIYIKPFDENLNLFYPENTSKCGFGSMLALGTDGYIYSCFRLLPHGSIDTRKYAQGHVNTSISENINNMQFLREGCDLSKMDIPESNVYGKNCKECPLLKSCQYCSAGCLTSGGNHFKFTSSICWWTKLQFIFQVKYARQEGTYVNIKDIKLYEKLYKEIKEYIDG